MQLYKEILTFAHSSMIELSPDGSLHQQPTLTNLVLLFQAAFPAVSLSLHLWQAIIHIARTHRLSFVPHKLQHSSVVSADQLC